MRHKWIRKLASIILPALAGGLAAFFTPLSFWFDMKEGIIAFLGFVAASLMQVMPITANFVQADRLNPKEAQQIVDSLTRQQHYWIGLLSATIVTLLTVIIGSALKTKLEPFTSEWHGLSWSSIPVFFIAAFFSFVLIKIVNLLDGILSLHNLRSELVMIAAKRAAEEKKASLIKGAQSAKAELPRGYGSVVEHPGDK